jgi:hypothetical protein
MATPADARAAIDRARNQLPPSDQVLLVKVARQEPLVETERCKVVRAMFRGYNLIPLAESARVLRRVDNME